MKPDEIKKWNEFYVGDRVMLIPDLFIVRRFVHELLKSERRMAVLGCGPGRHVIWLAKEGYQVYGVDYSASALDYCNKWAIIERVKDRVLLQEYDLRSKEFLESKHADGFEGIILDYVIEYLDDESALELIRWAFRNLKVGGWLFILERGQRDSAFSGGPRSDDFATIKQRSQTDYKRMIQEVFYAGDTFIKTSTRTEDYSVRGQEGSLHTLFIEAMR